LELKLALFRDADVDRDQSAPPTGGAGSLIQSKLGAPEAAKNSGTVAYIRSVEPSFVLPI
jgi:hypothetical protein